MAAKVWQENRIQVLRVKKSILVINSVSVIIKRYCNLKPVYARKEGYTVCQSKKRNQKEHITGAIK